MESDNIAWLGHASFAINSGDTLVYIDPFRLDADAKRADVVLVTHPHFDHFSVSKPCYIVRFHYTILT